MNIAFFLAVFLGKKRQNSVIIHDITTANSTQHKSGKWLCGERGANRQRNLLYLREYIYVYMCSGAHVHILDAIHARRQEFAMSKPGRNLIKGWGAIDDND